MRRLSRLRPSIAQLLKEHNRHPYTILRVCSACAPQLSSFQRRAFSQSCRSAFEDEKQETKFPPTWAGLEWVGTKEWTDAYMAPRETFQPFIPTEKTDAEQTQKELLNTLVEVAVAQSIGVSLAFDRISDHEWPEGIKIISERDGQNSSLSVEFAEEEDQEQLIDALFADEEAPNVEEPADLSEEGLLKPAMEQSDLHSVQENQASSTQSTQEEPSVNNASAAVEELPDQNWTEDTSIAVAEENAAAERDESVTQKDRVFASTSDTNWRYISLGDPEFKFNVMKRIMQRTGVHLPDPFIQSCSTVGALYDKLIEKPKAKKLAESIQVDSRLVQLVQLPNVKYHSRRVTPIDKEKEVGRWKVIEEELTARGLPVTGHMG